MRLRLLPRHSFRHSRFTLANRITSVLPTIWELGSSVNTTALVGSNRARAVSTIHGSIRLGPAFEVEDWHVRSGGRCHLLSMIRSR